MLNFKTGLKNLIIHGNSDEKLTLSTSQDPCLNFKTILTKSPKPSGVFDTFLGISYLFIRRLFVRLKTSKDAPHT